VKLQKSSKLYGYYIQTTSILAGTAFAALILLIEVKGKFLAPEWFPIKDGYSDLLVMVTAIIVVLFFIACVGAPQVAVRSKSPTSRFARLITTFAEAGMYGILVLLPLLVLPFSLVGAIVLSTFELAVTLVFGLYSRAKESILPLENLQYEGKEDPSVILKRRLANGELTVQEYEEIRKILERS